MITPTNPSYMVNDQQMIVKTLKVRGRKLWTPLTFSHPFRAFKLEAKNLTWQTALLGHQIMQLCQGQPKATIKRGMTRLHLSWQRLKKRFHCLNKETIFQHQN
mmetsp:Transcript_39907/g.65595  ORF Transcript_39907/g.65595 Transcript_39907/m.65595 type:complete len:103 (+) Transcript_39907:171-479(+)